MKCNVANGACNEFVNLNRHIFGENLDVYINDCMHDHYMHCIKECPHRLLMNRLQKAYKNGHTHSVRALNLYIQWEKEFK